MKPEASRLLELLGGVSARNGRSAVASDPEALFQLAQNHQVAALVYWRSRHEQTEDELPAEVRGPFRLAYLHHLMRNGVLVETALELDHELERRGVVHVIFKGPWLAFHAYPDPGTRPIDDIDLGVQEADYSGAIEALEALGYGTADPLPADGADALKRAHYGRQLRFTCRGRRPVELHFRMVNLGPPSDAERWLWDGVRRLDVEGGSLPTPSPEAMLMHLLMHANQHGFAVLRLLFDVRFALEREAGSIDLPRCLELIRTYSFARSAWHTLELARELAGATVPSALLDPLRPGPLARARFSRLWNLPIVRRLEVVQRPTAMESPRFYLLEMGGLGGKARYLRGITKEAGGPLALARLLRGIKTAGS